MISDPAAVTAHRTADPALKLLTQIPACFPLRLHHTTTAHMLGSRCAGVNGWISRREDFQAMWHGLEETDAEIYAVVWETKVPLPAGSASDRATPSCTNFCVQVAH